MDNLTGTLSLKMHVSPEGSRDKMVQLHSWPCVERDACEELLAGFFMCNPRLDRRMCHAQWVVSDWVEIPGV